MNNTVIKAVEILKLLSAHPEGLSLAGIVKALVLPKSTTFNIVRTLESLGMVDLRQAGVPVYTLGTQAMEIGLSCLNGMTLEGAARPVLSALCKATDETVFMSVRSGENKLVYIMKYLSNSEFQTIASVGTVRPLLSVAMGKAMLSAFSDREIAESVTQQMLDSCSTPEITDTKSLLHYLQQARHRGYVVETTSENPSFASSVAAPVLDGNGQLSGAISVVIMRDPHNMERVEALGKQANAAALEISRRLGYLKDTLYE